MTAKTELWELIGPYWKLPIRVVWFSQLAEIRVGGGVTLLPKQIAAADELLSSFAHRTGTKFFASMPALIRYAIKSTQDDPQDIVEWLPTKKGREVKSDFDSSDFINGYCGSPYTLIKDPLVADAVWQSFCRWAFHNILNLRKEVDLFFVRLVPLFFRKNWTGVLATKETQLFRNHKMTRHEYLNPDFKTIINRGVGDIMVGNSLTGYDARNGVYRSTIEAIPTDQWEKMSLKLEMERRTGDKANKTNKTGYAYRIKRILKDQLPKAIEVYRHFLVESKFKVGVFPASLNDSRFNQLRTNNYKTAPVAEAPEVRVNNLPSCVGVAASEREVGTAEAEGLHEVPDLQPDEQDVRDSGENVPDHERE